MDTIFCCCVIPVYNQQMAVMLQNCEVQPPKKTSEEDEAKDVWRHFASFISIEAFLRVQVK